MLRRRAQTGKKEAGREVLFSEWTITSDQRNAYGGDAFTAAQRTFLDTHPTLIFRLYPMLPTSGTKTTKSTLGSWNKAGSLDKTWLAETGLNIVEGELCYECVMTDNGTAYDFVITTNTTSRSGTLDYPEFKDKCRFLFRAEYNKVWGAGTTGKVYYVE